MESLRISCCKTTRVLFSLNAMGRLWAANARGTSTFGTSLCVTEWTWRRSAFIGVPPRIWLPISGRNLCRAVTSEGYEITSWVGWDVLNPRVMLVAPTGLSRRRWHGRSRWRSVFKTVPGFCPNSHMTIAAQECVGVYRVWSGLCDLRTDHTLPRYWTWRVS